MNINVPKIITRKKSDQTLCKYDIKMPQKKPRKTKTYPEQNTTQTNMYIWQLCFSLRKGTDIWALAVVFAADFHIYRHSISNSIAAEQTVICRVVKSLQQTSRLAVFMDFRFEVELKDI